MCKKCDRGTRRNALGDDCEVAPGFKNLTLLDGEVAVADCVADNQIHIAGKGEVPARGLVH